ncbi:unnamed protein product [Didymodactylos carnosus]|uniref:nicotinamidase n=1 Tax=Didymodactylos carnosus TaxID=1234261 RepID=A0A816ABW4_9BILA|nr:unnamed protein product [Didymodactylos carnosus]CAF4469860.1 unnamed protein product [Didymodactylos carnosus]
MCASENQFNQGLEDTNYPEKTLDSVSSIQSSTNKINQKVSSNALIIVDVQNDFIDGTLALKDCPAKQDGAEVVPIINNLLKTVHFDTVFYTLDWHPKDHISFYENLHLRKHLISPESSVNGTTAKQYDVVTFNEPIGNQLLWPVHCVQNTTGAKLHKDLLVTDNHIFIFKGKRSDIDSYSAFWSNQKLTKTDLDEKLKERNIRNVYIVGLATDYCVSATALHSLENKYRTIVIEDACRGVDEATIIAKINELKQKGCEFVKAHMVKSMVNRV